MWHCVALSNVIPQTQNIAKNQHKSNFSILHLNCCPKNICLNFKRWKIRTLRSNAKFQIGFGRVAATSWLLQVYFRSSLYSDWTPEDVHQIRKLMGKA